MRIKLLILLLLVLFISCKKKPEQIFELTFRLNAPEPLNYTIELNHSFIKSGTLEAGWNDIKTTNQAGIFMIYFGNADYYTDSIIIPVFFSKENKIITKELNLQKCNKKGKINVTLNQKIEKGKKGDYSMTFKAENTVKKISYCIYQTIGIIKAEPHKDVALCDYDIWKNTTMYGNLTNNNYFCDYLVLPCKSLNGIRCENVRFNPPFPVKADKCFMLAKSLQDTEYNILLQINTMDYFDQFDHLYITIMDMDLSPEHRILGKEWGYGVDRVVLEKELR